MILLLNSAVMPNEGVYTLKRISEARFTKEIQEAAETGDFKSYIGYPQTAQLIEQTTGITVEVSRAQATLTPGDIMLIVKLRQRIANPMDKETLQLSIDDFEFYQCNWEPIGEGKTS